MKVIAALKAAPTSEFGGRDFHSPKGLRHNV